MSGLLGVIVGQSSFHAERVDVILRWLCGFIVVCWYDCMPCVGLLSYVSYGVFLSY